MAKQYSAVQTNQSLPPICYMMHINAQSSSIYSSEITVTWKYTAHHSKLI